MRVWPPRVCPATHPPRDGGRDCSAGKRHKETPYHGPTWAHPPQPPDREQKRAGREGKGVQAEGTHTSKNMKMRDHVKERAQTSSLIRVPGGPAGQGLGWE